MNNNSDDSGGAVEYVYEIEEEDIKSDKTYIFCLKLLNEYTSGVIAISTNKKIPGEMDQQRKDIIKYMVAGKELLERLQA